MFNDDASNLDVPFLVDEEANHLGNDDSRTSKTSFFKTCFNGVNALSGSTSKLLLKTIKIS